MTTDIIIAAIFFIIGLIPAYYFYKKSIRIKEPVYSVKSANLISSNSSTFPGLAVLYQGEPVKDFTISKLLFFNAGAVTLDRDDIARRNPLKIVANSGNILDAAILAVSNQSSEFDLKMDRANGCIQLDFEYLNQNDGAVVILVHTGAFSEDIEVVGAMKEVKSIKRLAPHSLVRSRPPGNLTIAVAEAAALGLGVLSFIILMLVWNGYLSIRDGFLVGIFTTMAVLGLVLFLQKVSEMMRYRTRKIIPDGLELFESDEYYPFPDRG